MHVECARTCNTCAEAAVGWGYGTTSPSGEPTSLPTSEPTSPPSSEPTSAPKYDYNEYWDTGSPIYQPTWSGSGKEAAVAGCVNIAGDDFCDENEWWCDEEDGGYTVPGRDQSMHVECARTCNTCAEAAVGYNEWWDTASPMYSPTYSGANQEAELAKGETEHFTTPNHYVLYGGIIFIGLVFAFTIRYCNRKARFANNMEALLEHTEEL